MSITNLSEFKKKKEAPQVEAFKQEYIQALQSMAREYQKQQLIEETSKIKDK